MNLARLRKTARVNQNWTESRTLVTEFLGLAPPGERTAADVLRDNTDYIVLVREISGPKVAKRLAAELVAETERARKNIVPANLRIPIARLKLPKV